MNKHDCQYFAKTSLSSPCLLHNNTKNGSKVNNCNDNIQEDNNGMGKSIPDDGKLKKKMSSSAFNDKQIIEQLEEKIKLQEQLILELETKLQKSRKKRIQSEKQATRLQHIAKFDKIARQGQIKKTKVMELELQEVQHDNFVLTQIRDAAERKVKMIDRVLQRERAIHLMNIHEKQTIEKEKNETIEREKQLQINFFKKMDESNQMKDKICYFETEVNNQDQLIYENDVEFDKNMNEIERLKLQINEQNDLLQQKHFENAHHVKMRIKLERENESLRTKLILVSKSGGRKERKCRISMSSVPSVAMEKYSNLKLQKLDKINYSKNKATKCERSELAGHQYYNNIKPSYMKKGLTKQFVNNDFSDLTLADVAYESRLIDQGIIPDVLNGACD